MGYYDKICPMLKEIFCSCSSVLQINQIKLYSRFCGWLWICFTECLYRKLLSDRLLAKIIFAPDDNKAHSIALSYSECGICMHCTLLCAIGHTCNVTESNLDPIFFGTPHFLPHNQCPIGWIGKQVEKTTYFWLCNAF